MYASRTDSPTQINEGSRVMTSTKVITYEVMKKGQ